MRTQLASAVVAMTLCQMSIEPARAHYTIVDVNGSGSTQLFGINTKGQVAGSVGGLGFIRDNDGSILQLQVPGYGAPVPAGINNRGDVAGTASYGCNGEPDCQVGFLRLANGTATAFFASGQPNDGTNATAINAKGEVVGYFFDVSTHGFIRHPDGTVRVIDVPGGQDVVLAAINDKGYAAGLYNENGTLRGLLVAPDGTETTFDVSSAQSTFVTGLNDDNTIVGFCGDKDFNETGYIRGADGTVTKLDLGLSSRAAAINRFGEIAGYFVPKKRDSTFVLRPSGKLATFKAKGRALTDASSINDHGVVAGTFSVLDQGTWKYYGFIWRP